VNKTTKLIAQGLILAVAAAQGLDILTTNAALAAQPGAFESNPIEAFLMAHLGAAWWLPKAAVALVLLHQAVTLDHMNRWRWALLSGGAKTYALVLISNYFHLL
jgi:hypothetical protein